MTTETNNLIPWIGKHCYCEWAGEYLFGIVVGKNDKGRFKFIVADYAYEGEYLVDERDLRKYDINQTPSSATDVSSPSLPLYTISDLKSIKKALPNLGDLDINNLFEIVTEIKRERCMKKDLSDVDEFPSLVGSPPQVPSVKVRTEIKKNEDSPLLVKYHPITGGIYPDWFSSSDEIIGWDKHNTDVYYPDEVKPLMEKTNKVCF